MSQLLPWLPPLSVLLHILAAASISLRVIMRKRPSGESFAWIVLAVTIPVAGVALYLLVGEHWLSGRRSRRTAAVAKKLIEPVREVEERFGVTIDDAHPGAKDAAAIGRATGYALPIAGNALEVIGDDEDLFTPLIAAIDDARETCKLLYYIWQSDGRVRDVEDALLRAHRRGVECRVLVDALGGKHLLRAGGAKRLRDAGVQVRAALDVSPLRGKLGRIDIRNHRKLAVIDDRVAFAGSHNMVDPKRFMSGAGFGEWIDLTLRVEGPSASMLGALFELDWAMEDTEPLDFSHWHRAASEAGDAVVQVVPSGPGQNPEALRYMFSAAVHGARESLVLTTPYLVPDRAFMAALLAAPLRGVDTTVVVPARINGALVAPATRSFYEPLIDAGVRLLAYEGGLLHAKTVVADDRLAILGTVNLDLRSFFLNYELSLIVQGGPTVNQIRAAQQAYIDDSHRVSDSAWMRRGRLARFKENAAQLVAPLL